MRSWGRARRLDVRAQMIVHSGSFASQRAARVASEAVMYHVEATDDARRLLCRPRSWGSHLLIEGVGDSYVGLDGGRFAASRQITQVRDVTAKEESSALTVAS